MRRLELIPLDPASCDAIAADPAAALPGLGLGGGAAILPEVAAATGAMLRASGAAAPWIAYLARRGDEIFGTCAFKAPPADGEVEIAYFTFPGGEGRSHGRAMAEALARLAFVGGADRLVACTPPEDGASPAILTRLGFLRDGVSPDPEAGETWRWVLARQAA